MQANFSLNLGEQLLLLFLHKIPFWKNSISRFYAHTIKKYLTQWHTGCLFESFTFKYLENNTLSRKILNIKVSRVYGGNMTALLIFYLLSISKIIWRSLSSLLTEIYPFRLIQNFLLFYCRIRIYKQTYIFLFKTQNWPSDNLKNTQ